MYDSSMRRVAASYGNHFFPHKVQTNNFRLLSFFEVATHRVTHLLVALATSWPGFLNLMRSSLAFLVANRLYSWYENSGIHPQ